MRQHRKLKGGRGGRRHGSPLTFEERERAEGLARRLQAEMSRLLDGLPGGRAGASALARRLSLSRPVCQRIIMACEPSVGLLDVLVRGPGAEGLSQFIDAAEAAGAPVGRVSSARAASSRFGELLADLGGSQSALARRVRATLGQPAAAGGGAEDEDTRADLYQAAARITGRHVATVLQIAAIRCLDDDPSRFEVAFVSGQIGAEALAGGMPLVRAWVAVSPATGSDAARDYSAPTLLEDFSTQPLPSITAQDDRSVSWQVIDPDHVMLGRPIDIVVANKAKAPGELSGSGESRVIDVYRMMRSPARQLVIDVWLDESLARASIPSASAYLWGPTVEIDREPRWFDALPESPRLEVLGTDVGRASTPSYPRHVELTTQFLKTLGWDRSPLVGYRCAITYPVWGAVYRVRFQF